MPSNTVSAKDILLNSKTFFAENSSSDINKAADKYVKDNELNEIAVEKDNDILDIFLNMITKMFEKIDIDPMKVKNIFYTNYKQYDYDDIVNIPDYLQAKYKLFNANVVIVNQHCSSVLQAMRIADSINKSEKGTYSLIISPYFAGETEDRYISFAIMGDGASIMLIGDDDYNKGFKIIDSSSITDGYVSYYYHEHFKKIELTRYDEMKLKLMVYKSIENTTAKIFEKYREWINDSKIRISSNIGKKITDMDAKVLGDTYQNYYGGHIGEVDIPRNLKDIMDSNKFEKGDKIVLFAIGGDFGSINAISVFCEYE
jgi:3-oxoacyl-[acyl-carrier-protein] synthase III